MSFVPWRGKNKNKIRSKLVLLYEEAKVTLSIVFIIICLLKLEEKLYMSVKLLKNANRMVSLLLPPWKKACMFKPFFFF